MKEKTDKPEFVLNKALCFALYNASRAMNQLYRVHLAEVDLTYPQLLALSVLWNRDQCSVTEMGDILRLDSGTLTPLLKRLENQKLIIRKRSKEDERRVEISLSAEGKKVQEQLKCLPRDMLRDLDMTSKQVVALADSIDQVTQQIEHTLRDHAKKAGAFLKQQRN